MAPLLLRRTAVGLLSATVVLVVPAWQATAEAAASQASANGQANSNSNNSGHGDPGTQGPPTNAAPSGGAGTPGAGGAPGAASNGNANGNGNGNGNGSSGSGQPASNGLGGGSQSVSGAGDAPPGNNGHIQIEELDGAPADSEHGNDPHVSCAGFIVEFFGYDGGPQQATLILTPWAPTPGTPSPLGPIAWNVGGRTNGNQLDASYPVSGSVLASVLSTATPVAQGYHVRVEVEVSGSQGADDKFHMLWIAPCDTPPVVTPPTSTGTPPVTSSGGTPPLSTGGGILQGLSGVALARPPVSTAPATTQGATVGDKARLPSVLAFTGAELAALALAGLLALGAGTAIVLEQRRRRRLAASAD